jgi:hypothetical protein
MVALDDTVDEPGSDEVCEMVALDETVDETTDGAI